MQNVADNYQNILLYLQSIMFWNVTFLIDKASKKHNGKCSPYFKKKHTEQFWGWSLYYRKQISAKLFVGDTSEYERIQTGHHEQAWLNLLIKYCMHKNTCAININDIKYHIKHAKLLSIQVTQPFQTLKGTIQEWYVVSDLWQFLQNVGWNQIKDKNWILHYIFSFMFCWIRQTAREWSRAKSTANIRLIENAGN